MLKLSQKRGRDWNECVGHVEHCSPVRGFRFTGVETPSSPVEKKLRLLSSEVMQEVEIQDPGSFQKLHNSRGDSPFTASVEPPADPLHHYLSKRPRKTHGSDVDMVFTHEQVQEIVARRVAESEANLRLLYDRILNEKLQEQWLSFSKYLEDQISRHMKQREEPSYIG